MSSKIAIDACGIFAFFQMHKPIKLSNFNLSDDIKREFYKLLLKKGDYSIPVPAVSEVMNKYFKNGYIRNFRKFMEELSNQPNISFPEWNYEIMVKTINYVKNKEIKLKDYFKKSPEIFDLTIFQICKSKGINKIISKDQVFDELYGMQRIW